MAETPTSEILLREAIKELPKDNTYRRSVEAWLQRFKEKIHNIQSKNA